MKIIDPEYQSSAAATSENSEYPASNLMDNRPNKKWQSLGTSAVVTMAVGAGVNNAIGVYGICADTVVVTVKNAAETVIIATESFTISRNRLWFEFAEQIAAIHILLAFSRSAGVCSAGVIKVGDAQSIPNPEYGIDRSYTDASILHEMASGGLRVHQRSRYRNLNPSFVMTAAEAQDLDDIYFTAGADPLAMLILAGDNTWRQEWTGLFQMPVSPKTVFKFNDQHLVTLQLREAV